MPGTCVSGSFKKNATEPKTNDDFLFLCSFHICWMVHFHGSISTRCREKREERKGGFSYEPIKIAIIRLRTTPKGVSDVLLPSAVIAWLCMVHLPQLLHLNVIFISFFNSPTHLHTPHTKYTIYTIYLYLSNRPSPVSKALDSSRLKTQDSRPSYHSHFLL